MEGPANTLNYFTAGYIVILGTLAVYIVTLIVRWRNLKRDEAVLADLEKKEDNQ